MIGKLFCVLCYDRSTVTSLKFSSAGYISFYLMFKAILASEQVCVQAEQVFARCFVGVIKTMICVG